MMMKTRMFIAKQFAKKHYKGAMDAMKSLKGKMTPTPEGVLGARARMQTALRSGSYKIGQFKKSTKAKAMAAGSKVKTFAKKNKVALVAGGGAAGTVAGYQSGKKRERKVAIKSIQKMGLAQAAGDLGIRSSVRGLSDKQKVQIVKKMKKNIVKDMKQYRSFYS